MANRATVNTAGDMDPSAVSLTTKVVPQSTTATASTRAGADRSTPKCSTRDTHHMEGLPSPIGCRTIVSRSVLDRTCVSLAHRGGLKGSAQHFLDPTLSRRSLWGMAITSG